MIGTSAECVKFRPNNSATTGLTPAAENEVMKRYLAGGFLGDYSTGQDVFEED